MKKPNKLILSRQKGWRGYVHSFNDYVDAYDKTKWDGKGTIKPKKVVTDGSKTTITF